MLNEYKNSPIWKSNPDEINLRSDLLVTNRVMEFLGDIRGKKVLDAGCGNGKVSRLLAKAGATVIGIDKVEDQITTAKNTNPELGIKYFIGDITNFNALDLSNDFDIGVSLMTFLYLDKDEFVQAVKQIRKHLKLGARFIYGNIDPLRFKSDGVNMANIEKLEAELPTVNGGVFKTTFYKHTYEFVVKSFVDNGFSILSEIKPRETVNEIEQYAVLFPTETVGKGQYIILDMEAV